MLLSLSIMASYEDDSKDGTYSRVGLHARGYEKMDGKHYDEKHQAACFHQSSCLHS